MWLFRSGEDGLPPIVLYHYTETRARYNAVDRRNPDKKVEGVPMNVFDHLIDNMGKLHFEKLNQYSHKMTMEKKAILEAKNRQKNKSKK